MTTLSRLTTLEATIANGMETFMDVGNALRAIRDDRLYRDGYKSFEEYVKERWGWGKAHAYRMIQAAEVDENLSPIGDAKPKNEAQLREVAKAPVEHQAAVVEAAAAKAAEENREPTAKDYKAAVDELQYEDCDEEPEPAKPVEQPEYDAKVIKAWAACGQRLGTLRRLLAELTDIERTILQEWLSDE